MDVGIPPVSERDAGRNVAASGDAKENKPNFADMLDGFRFRGAGASVGTKTVATLPKAGARCTQSQKPNSQLRKRQRTGATSSYFTTMQEARKKRSRSDCGKGKDMRKWSTLRDFSLDYESLKLQLLVAIILSKQTQPPVVLRAVDAIRKHPDAGNGKVIELAKLASFKFETLKHLISFVHYNKQKARQLLETAKMICGVYKRKVPIKRHHLVRFPGVGPLLSQVLINILPTEDEFEREHEPANKSNKEALGSQDSGTGKELKGTARGLSDGGANGGLVLNSGDDKCSEGVCARATASQT